MAFPSNGPCGRMKVLEALGQVLSGNDQLSAVSQDIHGHRSHTNFGDVGNLVIKPGLSWGWQRDMTIPVTKHDLLRSEQDSSIRDRRTERTFLVKPLSERGRKVPETVPCNGGGERLCRWRVGGERLTQRTGGAEARSKFPFPPCHDFPNGARHLRSSLNRLAYVLPTAPTTWGVSWSKGSSGH